MGSLVACSNEQNSSSTGQDKTTSEVTTQPVQENNEGSEGTAQETKSWSSANKEVKLTPVKVNENGAFESVSVEVNGQKKEFNWKSPEEPRISYVDVTGDNKPEAVIITNKGKGTGTSVDELHVLSSEDLSEIKVPNYEEIVADHIETHVTKNDDGKLAIKVKAQGKEQDFSYAADPGLEVKDKLNFGGTVFYEVKDQTLSSRIGGSVGTSPVYVCDFVVTYKYDSAKNQFIVDHIVVEPTSK